MYKAEAIQQLGGSIPAAAKAIGVSYQAVNQWPEVLPVRIVDRVQAALYRKQQAEAAAQGTSTAQEVSHG
ncbi:Cro/CI family transcriptional regulator [Comamonas jiangduensis]|uniref:Cro/CI family transcriptional regulator n=1 Tax=Comamonas jiangduensis TaxID=1194168 RepID=UPI003BF825EF